MKVYIHPRLHQYRFWVHHGRHHVWHHGAWHALPAFDRWIGRRPD